MKPLSYSEYRRIAEAVGRVEALPPRSEVDLPPRTAHPVAETLNFVRFELAADLTANDTTAAAHVLVRDPTTESQELQFWDGQGNLIATTVAVAELELETIEVWSFNGWTGTGRDETDPEAIVEGTRGIAVHMLDVDKWEVISGGSSSKFAVLDDILEAGDSIEATIWGGDPLAATEQTVTVYDRWLPTGEELASGTKIEIKKESGKWYVVNAWVEKTFITDIQLGTGYIQKKTAKIVCCWADDDSAWTNAIQTTDCS